MSAKLNSTVLTDLLNKVSNTTDNVQESLYPITLVVPFTIIYGIIFFIGVIGNVSTCIVIAKNKSMHTATNYYLFSLAISDMLLLISGLPPEMYRIWSPDDYIFGEAFCVLQGFAAETSANATVLTITSFTIERYLAICHPFLSHTMSKLSRAIKYIIAIWMIALALAVPQAIQFGIEVEYKDGVQNTHCTVVKHFFEHAFQISTFVFFVGPMTLITILYVLIGVQLRKSKNMAAHRPSTSSSVTNEPGRRRILRNTAAQNRVVKMLIAVVAAFFVCWAPFHAQRLLAVYLAGASKEAQNAFFNFYLYLMYTSGVLYFVSTTINPVLYHIMSKKFRKAFKKTFFVLCCRCQDPGLHQYSGIKKVPPSMRNMQRSVSDGVTQVNQDFLDYRKGLSENPRNGKIQHNSKSPQTSPDSFFLNSSRSHSLIERQKSFNVNNNYGNKTNKSFFIVPVRRFYKIFSRNNMNRHIFEPGNFESGNYDSANTISNSSLRDTDVTEFSYSDLVNNMLEINETIK